jgi:hypothetical protein
VVKQGALQLQTVPQAQDAAQLVVTPLQVTCPRSFDPQLRSTAEQLPEPEQLTGMEPLPQLAVQELFVGTFRLAAKTAPSGAPGLVTAGGLASAGAGEGVSPGTCAKPATAIKATRQARMLAFISFLLSALQTLLLVLPAINAGIGVQVVACLSRRTYSRTIGV